MTEALLETFIRKQLRFKAHRVTKLEESDEGLSADIDRLQRRRLRCGLCGQLCPKVHRRFLKERRWRDPSLRQAPLVLR